MWKKHLTDSYVIEYRPNTLSNIIAMIKYKAKNYWSGQEIESY